MANEVGQPIVDLRDYWRAIWARKWQVAGVTVGVMIAVLGLSLRQTPIYVAEAQVLVLPIPDSSALLEAKMNTEAQLVRSDAVAESVAATMGSDDADALLSGLHVTPIQASTILIVGYSSKDPSTAAELANAFAQSYVDVRTEDLTAPIAAQLSSLRRQIAAMRQEIDARPANVGDLQSRLEGLIQDVTDLRARASGKQGGEIVKPAEAPSAPASPDLLANMVLALAGGLALGIVIALIRDAMDRQVRSREDLERRVGAPVLAVVPRIAGWRSGGEPELTLQLGSRNAATEAYGALATNVRYSGTQHPLKVLTVTSALPGEGKTVTTAHLGLALAESGLRVLIVSGDLRRPRIHTMFGLDGGPGLTDAVTGSASLSDVITETSVPMLSVIRSGPLPDNPVALLARLQGSGLLTELREQFDMVVCDSPPVLPVADAAVLASVSDGVVFVYSPLKSNRQAVTESRDRLRVGGARIIGVVYNNVDVRGRDKFYGSYAGPYLSEDGQRPSTTSTAEEEGERLP
jgi:capsular exopolysaccharide synthesis family protein